MSNLEPAFGVSEDGEKPEVKVAAIKLAYFNGTLIPLLKLRGEKLARNYVQSLPVEAAILDAE